jgi:hypothetical protein
MRFPKLPRPPWGLMALAMLAIMAVVGRGTDPTRESLKDRALPAGHQAAGNAGPAAPGEPSPIKAVIENPTKSVVRDTSTLTADVNPRVEPGKVRWHATFQAACEAARRSGKPVLLFQMMGKLDDQFC